MDYMLRSLIIMSLQTTFATRVYPKIYYRYSVIRNSIKLICWYFTSKLAVVVIIGLFTFSKLIFASTGYWLRKKMVFRTFFFLLIKVLDSETLSPADNTPEFTSCVKVRLLSQRNPLFLPQGSSRKSPQFVSIYFSCGSNNHTR